MFAQAPPCSGRPEPRIFSPATFAAALSRAPGSPYICHLSRESRTKAAMGCSTSLRGVGRSQRESQIMNLEKYTERARGFVQSAQSLAVREGHQQFTPEHILKVLLDDEEGLAAGLSDR